MTLSAISVRGLIGHPGASRTDTIRGTVEGLETELARVPDDAPLRGEVLLESVVEGILLTGRIDGTWRLRCARCLTEFDGRFEVEVSEMFVVDADLDGDDYAFDPEAGIEPDQMVRDAIGVELPF